MVPVNGFYRNVARGNGLSPFCIECQLADSKLRRQRQKLKAFALLGGHCQGPECDVPGGNTDPRVLQFDHVNGQGNKHRRESGQHALLAVLRGETGFQLLCANCNWRKKISEDETVGDRIYVRSIAEKIEGPGYGSHPNTKAAIGKWWNESSPEVIARRNERMGRSKRLFTDEQEDEIRVLRAAGAKLTDLAKQFSCSQPLISNIVNRKGTTR
jgi:hypothetical protein